MAAYTIDVRREGGISLKASRALTAPHTGEIRIGSAGGQGPTRSGFVVLIYHYFVLRIGHLYPCNGLGLPP